MFDVLDIGASGLQAQRTRLDTIAANIANVSTTHDAQGRPNPYRRRFVVFEPGQPGNPEAPGVRVARVELDKSPFNKRHEPRNKDADAEGDGQDTNIDPAIATGNAHGA